MRIHLSRPDITEKEIESVCAVLRSPELSLGPKLAEFEEAFTKYIGRKRAVAVNSGTSGLFLCMPALGIGQGDEVIDVYQETAWAAIVYLNDSYEGGKTYFESCPELPMGFEIQPQRGKIVMFEGMEFYHGVTKVRRSDRYTIAMWFTRNWKTMAPDLRI